MEQTKLIKVSLNNGSLSGVMVAEIYASEGVFITTAKKHFSDMLDLPEVRFSGVYLLLNGNEVKINTTVNLSSEFKKIDDDQSWDRIVFLTTHNNSFDATALDFIKLALSDPSNPMNDSSNFVDRYKKFELNTYVSNALLLLELWKIRVSKKAEQIKPSVLPPKIAIPASPVQPSPYDIYQLLMTKSKALTIFTDDLKNADVITYAKLQIGKKVFWANPLSEYIKHEWYFILDNPKIRKLYLLYIPKFSLTIHSANKSGIRTRNDRPRLDINLTETTLIDTRSKISFMQFVIREVSY